MQIKVTKESHQHDQCLKGLHLHSFVTGIFEELGPQNKDLFASLMEACPYSILYDYL